MCRDYVTMRKVMSTIAEREGQKLIFNDFAWAFDRKSIATELKRLKKERLITSTLEFEDDDTCLGGEVRGFTSEGEEFWHLIENKSVWRPILATLQKAQIDLSYPMLKEVCEEIVKRYVTRCIPEI